MDVNLLFKIAAVGILVTVIGQVLKHSGREEHAFLVSLAGLIIVLFWIVPYIYDLFDKIEVEDHGNHSDRNDWNRRGGTGIDGKTAEK